MSGKGKGKGGKGAAAAQPAAPAPPPPPSANSNPALLSAGARLIRRRRPPRPDPLALLTPEQRQLAESLMPPPPASPSSPSSPSSPAAGVPPPASELSQQQQQQLDGGGGAGGGPLAASLGRLGLPLGPADVASLVQQSLSGGVGQGVAFQPFVFNNLFQSAAATASYVASAFESGVAWGKVERFFLAAVEADGGLKGVRVQVKGRLSRKNDMAQTKTWSWGDIPLSNLAARLDYGFSAAHTRLGTLGVKVWICHKPGALTDVFFPPNGGSHYSAPTPPAALPPLTLDALYGAAAQRTTRLQLPYSFAAVGWWAVPAPAQPAENRVGLGPGEIFEAGFDPRVGASGPGGGLQAYLRRRREGGRTFRSAEDRRAYMETVGRFLAKQRRLTAPAALDGARDLGRRPPGQRPLGRFHLEVQWGRTCKRAAAARRRAGQAA